MAGFYVAMDRMAEASLIKNKKAYLVTIHNKFVVQDYVRRKEIRKDVVEGVFLYEYAAEDFVNEYNNRALADSSKAAMSETMVCEDEIKKGFRVGEDQKAELIFAGREGHKAAQIIKEIQRKLTREERLFMKIPAPEDILEREKEVLQNGVALEEMGGSQKK